MPDAVAEVADVGDAAAGPVAGHADDARRAEVEEDLIGGTVEAQRAVGVQRPRAVAGPIRPQLGDARGRRQTAELEGADRGRARAAVAEPVHGDRRARGQPDGRGTRLEGVVAAGRVDELGVAGDDVGPGDADR